jgi:hypothetical protein
MMGFTHVDLGFIIMLGVISMVFSVGVMVVLFKK